MRTMQVTSVALPFRVEWRRQEMHTNGGDPLGIYCDVIKWGDVIATVEQATEIPYDECKWAMVVRDEHGNKCDPWDSFDSFGVRRRRRFGEIRLDATTRHDALIEATRMLMLETAMHADIPLAID
jgi:hypothetical protein